MRSLVLSALLLGLAAPVFAQPAPYEARQEYRDQRDDRDRAGYRDDRHDDRFRDERRDDRREYRDDRREYRDDRREYREDQEFARFRGPAFQYPRGYGYRYYGVGNRLPRNFYTYRDFISRPQAYRLPPVYGGTRWVRVGPDAVLVRLRDGIVVRSIRGLFY